MADLAKLLKRLRRPTNAVIYEGDVGNVTRIRKMCQADQEIREEAATAIEALRDMAETVVFHYFNCSDGDGEGCGQLRPSMAVLAQAIGYNDPAVNDEIRAALAEVKNG